MKSKKLLEEGGITEVSLHNFNLLVEKNGGLPDWIVLEKREIFPKGMDVIHCKVGYVEQIVEATWVVDDEGTLDKFVFTGFSWGYAGEGPHGLLNVLNRCGVKYTIKEIAAMDENETYNFIIDKPTTIR